ncbi:retrovirus-related pol polyprotein from transposon TNT 1-94 [Tanacetum coccineum]
MTLELADRSITYPKGLAEDVYVKVGKFHFPADFVVVDFEADPRVPLILGKSFLKTGRTLIDVYEGEITLCVDNEAVTFNLDQTMKYSSTNDKSVNRIDIIDEICEEYVPELLGFPSDDFSSGNPTSTSEPFTSEFTLEEIDAYLYDKSISLESDHDDCDPEEDIFKNGRHCNEVNRINSDPSSVTGWRKKLTEAPILVVPDWNLPFELMCDASDFAIGAVLGQRVYNGHEALEILTACHEGTHGGHHSANLTARKYVIDLFLLATIYRDAHSMIKSYDTCQRQGKISQRDEMPQNAIQMSKALWAFGTAFKNTNRPALLSARFMESLHHLPVELEHNSILGSLRCKFSTLKTADCDHRKLQLNDLNESTRKTLVFSEAVLKDPEEKRLKKRRDSLKADKSKLLSLEYLLETQNVAVQDTNSSAQNDATILSVFEQLSNQVTNCNKVNKDNLITNKSLSDELERYKERVKLLEERKNVDISTQEKLIIDDIIQEKNAQFTDFEKEINNLKQTISEQSKENELLTKTFNVFKNESKEKEAKNIDTEISLEKKVKELGNIVCKMGQSAQTMHMLTKPQVFYDNNLKKALGFQNPFYLKKAQQIRPMLYDGNIIAKETNVISIADSEETLMLEEESRSKILLKQSDLMVLEKKVNTKPINYAELNRLSEDFVNDVPQLVDKKGGMEPYYLKCIKDDPFQPKTAEGYANPESQWTPDERRVVIQDQLLKSIIMSCLPDDIIEYVISYVSAKETWTDLVHSFEEQLKEEKKINEKWLTSSKKVSQCISEQIPHQKKKVLGDELLIESSSKKIENENLFVPASMGYDQEMIPKTKDWIERLNPDSKLPNFNTGRILVPESQDVNESLETSNTPESSKDSEAEFLTLLPPLKIL